MDIQTFSEMCISYSKSIWKNDEQRNTNDFLAYQIFGEIFGEMKKWIDLLIDSYKYYE
jgi:hypothetical protein